MGELLKFNVTYHSLNLYGDCNGACDKTLKK
jgi:Fur family ferric uptake transcriptional regulator